MTRSRGVGVVGAVIVATCGLYEIWALFHAMEQTDPTQFSDELWANFYKGVFLKVSVVLVFATLSALLIFARRISYLFVSAGWWLAALTGVTYGLLTATDHPYGTDFIVTGVLLFIVFSVLRSITTGIVAAMQPRFK